MALKLDYVVEMEDGKTYTITADQRDIARYETQPFAKPIDESPHTFMRFTAFSALDRAGVLKNGRSAMGWEAFNSQCVEVRDGANEDSPKA